MASMTKDYFTFVDCPNPDHVNQEGWKSSQLYYAGNGIFRCDSCGKEFTREEVQEEIRKDYVYKIQDVVRWYQQKLADLYLDKKHNEDKLDAEMSKIDSNG